jgi:acyl-CoA hydrolase
MFPGDRENYLATSGLKLTYNQCISFGKFAHCGDQNKIPVQIAHQIFLGKKKHKSHHILRIKKIKVAIFRQ